MSSQKDAQQEARVSFEDDYWGVTGGQFVMLRNPAGGGVLLGYGETGDRALRSAIKTAKRVLRELEKRK